MSAYNTGSFTASGAANSVVASGFGTDTSVLFEISGTFTGVSVVFEGSRDSGTTYFPVLAFRLDALQPDSGTLAIPDSTARAWKIDCSNLTNVRMRPTAVSTGTGSVQWSTGRFFDSSPQVLASPVGNASAGNVTAKTGGTSFLTSRPGNWSVNHTPASATQATASKAAGGAGVYHVCTSISATLAAGATAQAAAAILNLRDGATGAGTILWSKQVILPANGVWEVSISDLSIPGSANTAMTLEFAAAGATGTFESVSMTGYDVS